MDAEKSSNSSFEDLSNLNEADMKAASEAMLDKERFATNVGDTKKANEHVDSDSDSGAPASVGDDEPCDVLGNGQLIKRVIKKSKVNKKPQRGELVTITFTGKLADGTVVEKQENFQVHVGDFEVSYNGNITMANKS